MLIEFLLAELMKLEARRIVVLATQRGGPALYGGATVVLVGDERLAQDLLLLEGGLHLDLARKQLGGRV